MNPMEPSLLEALNNYDSACKWCNQSCPDEEKYETLVTCLRIQDVFKIIIKEVHFTIGKTSSGLINNIIYGIKVLNEEMQPDTKKIRNEITNSEGSWKLPGCCQLFRLAQSIEQTYLNKLRNID
jgi:hypothetical protein